MAKKDLSEYKRRYDIARHHAWAGSVLLSLLLAFRYFASWLPRYIVIPAGALLIIYIMIALVYTYRYRAGLSAQREPKAPPGGEWEKAKARSRAEKVRIKAEKKKVKSMAKIKKKDQKIARTMV